MRRDGRDQDILLRAGRTLPLTNTSRAMRRRRYLATVGAGLSISLAGCDGQEFVSSPTPSPTPEPTPTGTPSPAPPEILWAGPITYWDGAGDIQDRSVENFGQGGFFRAGAEYEVWVHDGEIDVDAQLDVYDEEGSRVSSDSFSDQQLADGSGLQPWSIRVASRIDDWDTGTYEGTLLIRDNILGETSSGTTFEADVVPSLNGDEATLEEYDGPETVPTGQPFDYELTIANESGIDSSIASPMSARYEGGDWTGLETMVVSNIAAGETASSSYSDATLPEPGEYTYRIDDIDETFTVTAE